MRARATAPDWRETAEGRAKYTAARSKAQNESNADGFDRLLTKNDFAKNYFVNLLPRLENRYGRDLDGEVVMCERLENCRPGHGPLATRPPERF